MTMPSSAFVELSCPRCETRLFFGREQAGQTVTCEMCHTRILLPKHGTWAIPKRAPAPVDAYRVLEDDEPIVRREYVSFECELCRTLLTAFASQAGQQVTCPDCHRSNIVPQPRPKSAAAPAPVEPYGLRDESQPPPPPIEYIPIHCAKCALLLHAPADDVKEKVRCPDCGFENSVPPVWRKSKKSAPLTETYRLREDDEPPSEQEGVTVECTACQARIFARLDQVGQTVTCPDCGKPATVPEPPKPRKAPASIIPYRLAGEDGISWTPGIQAAGEDGKPPTAHELYNKMLDDDWTSPRPALQLAPAPTTAPAASAEHDIYAFREDEPHVQRPDKPDISANGPLELTCSRCHNRIKARREQAGEALACPKCGQKLVFPEHEAAAQPLRSQSSSAGPGAGAPGAGEPGWQVPTTEPLPPPVARSSSGGPSPSAAPPRPLGDPPPRWMIPPWAANAASGPRAADPPPRWMLKPENTVPGGTWVRPDQERPPDDDLPDTPIRHDFFTAVWQIPWRKETLLRWMLTTLCIFVVSAVASACLLCIGAGSYWAVIGGVLLMVKVWVTILAVPYAAGNFVAIVQDTGNGSDRIRSWPAPDWGERFCYLMVVGWPLALSTIPGLLLGTLFREATGLPLDFWSLTAFLLFPPLVLSAITEGQFLAPFSRDIVLSFGRYSRGWLILYGLTFALWFPWIVLSIFLPWAVLFIVAAIGSPILAAQWFIYARLLGRLAWRVGQVTPASEPSMRRPSSLDGF